MCRGGSAKRSRRTAPAAASTRSVQRRWPRRSRNWPPVPDSVLKWAETPATWPRRSSRAKRWRRGSKRSCDRQSTAADKRDSATDTEEIEDRGKRKSSYRPSSSFDLCASVSRWLKTGPPSEQGENLSLLNRTMIGYAPLPLQALVCNGGVPAGPGRLSQHSASCLDREKPLRVPMAFK